MTTDSSPHSPAIFSLAVPTPHQGRSIALTRLSEVLMPSLSSSNTSDLGLALWTRTPQRDTKHVRTKGFWRLFPHLRAKLPANISCESTAFACSDGVRFLATAQVPSSGLAQALAVILAHTRCAGTALVGASDGIRAHERLLRTALHEAHSELELARLLLPLCERNHVSAIIPSGRFDDPDTGLFVCGPHEWWASSPELVVEP